MQRGSLRRRLRPSKARGEIVEKKWRRVKVSGQNRVKASLARSFLSALRVATSGRPTELLRFSASCALLLVQVELTCQKASTRALG